MLKELRVTASLQRRNPKVLREGTWLIWLKGCTKALVHCTGSLDPIGGIEGDRKCRLLQGICPGLYGLRDLRRHCSGENLAVYVENTPSQ